MDARNETGLSSRGNLGTCMVWTPGFNLIEPRLITRAFSGYTVAAIMVVINSVISSTYRLLYLSLILKKDKVKILLAWTYQQYHFQGQRCAGGALTGSGVGWHPQP